MELIIINENKLKIILSKPDMDYFGLDENEFHCSLSNAREILNKILKSCQTKTSFDNVDSKERLLLQLYPDKDGGCELFVTKLPIDYGSETKENIVALEKGNPPALPSRSEYGLTKIKKNTITYSFNSIDDLINACQSLKYNKMQSESELYSSINGKYYLILRYELNENKKSTPSSHLSEFGALENSENINLYVKEYGKCICKEGAIETLCQF